MNTRRTTLAADSDDLGLLEQEARRRGLSLAPSGVGGNWDESARVPPQQLDADTILRVLLSHDVEFVVIGGLAVAAHGFPRATKDVDVVRHNADLDQLEQIGSRTSDGRPRGCGNIDFQDPEAVTLADAIARPRRVACSEVDRRY